MRTALIGTAVRVALVLVAAYCAYDIRLYAIRTYGRLIHEFDPWFNFHATRYMFENGLRKFFRWFDHTAWYPIGRPVGTTIYPGMQLTSVGLYHVLKAVGLPMSLNDVCVFVPAWFGGVATVLTGLLAAEASGIPNALPAAAFIMSVIPAHIMRSVGGGYDNESIAVTAMVLTFFMWTRSLRTSGSWPIGVLAGLAYSYMVAAWGGYVFVDNLIGAHAGFLLLVDLLVPQTVQRVLFKDLNFENTIKAYLLFFVVGTFGAVHVPVVGWHPLRSMEHIGPLLVFFAYLVLGACEILRRRAGLSRGSAEFGALRRQVILVAAGALAVGLAVLMQSNYFGPLSLRVRGLFVKNAKTGNPLVDSVAEHQPATANAYWQYLHYMCAVAPFGFGLCFWKPNPGRIFLILYGSLAYFFSLRMNRLIILLGPVTSALAGVALGALGTWCLDQGKILVGMDKKPEAEGAEQQEAEQPAAKAADGRTGGKDARGKASRGKAPQAKAADDWVPLEVKALVEELGTAYRSPTGKLVRLVAAAAVLLAAPTFLTGFWKFCHMFAEATSQPSIVFQAQLNNGKRIIVTDYLDSYNWLRENTPQDSRVMSWWDYGYQITGIANRTTLADGNTWNLEHISLIARCLTSDEKRAHSIIRHLADYVLVWAGGGGDDLAKLPHIARIGNSVYSDICPNDPLCRTFGFYDQHRTPMPRTSVSIVYKMVEAGNHPGVSLNEKYFKEVYKSKYGKVRIYKVQKVSKKSKKWLADPANRLCDAPGSWYCPGQYPPDLPESVGNSHANLDYDAHGGHV